jgi:hypothetical protein
LAAAPTTGVLRDHAGVHGGAQYLPSELQDQPILSGLTVLPKLSVDGEVTSQATDNGRGHVSYDRVQTIPATARVGGLVQGEAPKSRWGGS